MCRVADAAQTIDEALFNAWQAGNSAACEQIWQEFHRRIFAIAVRFCARFGGRADPENAAADGFTRAWRQLERGPAPAKLRIVWLGEASLVAYVRNLVILRCRDALRVERPWFERLVDVLQSRDGEGGDVLELLSSVEAGQPELVRGEILRRVLRELALVTETCRCQGRDALLPVLLAIRGCIHDRLLHVVRRTGATRSDGRAWDSLSTDELADAIETAELENVFDKTAMRDQVMARLGMHTTDERNKFEQRMHDIRRMRDVDDTKA
jgi:DNA-directed RNA polymerase specialized sigma24 family protein